MGDVPEMTPAMANAHRAEGPTGGRVIVLVLAEQEDRGNMQVSTKELIKLCKQKDPMGTWDKVCIYNFSRFYRLFYFV